MRELDCSGEGRGPGEAEQGTGEAGRTGEERARTGEDGGVQSCERAREENARVWIREKLKGNN